MNELFSSIAIHQEQAKNHKQRIFLILSGNRSKCNNLAEQIAKYTKLGPIVSINTLNFQSGYSKSNSDAKHYLGQNIDTLIYDAFAGFDPDAFGILTGAIRGGGCCILICPNLSEWPDYNDPENDRISVYGHDTSNISGYYLKRIVKIFKRDTDVVYKNDILCCRILPLYLENSPTQDDLPTLDQKHIIAELLTFSQSTNLPSNVVITADRGRGKSAAMGIAAARMILQKSDIELCICAPKRKNLDTFFKHFNAEFDLQNKQQNTLLKISFYAPDTLLKKMPDLDLLFIDEAAAIALPILEKIICSFSKIIFSTTVHGYEGAGRGFFLRFSKILKHHNHHSLNKTLSTPIRYSENDPLEAAVSKLLMLDAQITDIPRHVEQLQINARLEEINHQHLLDNEALLLEVFALLVQAHYQTKPLDLRHIMDGANLKCYILRHNDLIIGSALVAIEGSIDNNTLKQCIMHGERRPRGHLLPQILSYQHLQSEYLTFKIARIVRIVIHPKLQNQGYGSMLLKKLEEKLIQEKHDALGACFGKSIALTRFWEKNGYSLLHISSRKNASSGLRSAVVLKGVSDNAIFAQRHSQKRYLRNHNSKICERLTTKDLEEIRSYCERSRNYEASESALIRFYSRYIRCVSDPSHEIIKNKVLKHASWNQVCSSYKLHGRRECENIIKSTTREVLAQNALSELPNK